MELLTSSSLLALFLVVALGAVLGTIPFGPLRLGAAGTLFVSIIVGFYVPKHGSQMALVQQLSLALFIYGVGLSTGQTFFRDLYKQYKLVPTAALFLVAAVAVTVLNGLGLDIKTELNVGVFTGALATTPALAAVTGLIGSQNPAMGYSLAYPAKVIIGVIMVGSFVTRRWPGQHDAPVLVGRELRAITAVVSKEISMRDVPGWLDQSIRMFYLRSGGSIWVIAPGQILNESNQVVMVGLPVDVNEAVAAVGHALPEHLANDRSVVEFQPFTVSRSRITGSAVMDLSLVARSGAMVTHIKRGDIEALMADDKTVELGDRLFMTCPHEEERNLAAFFGDSRNNVAQVGTIALRLGIACGVLPGMVKISLPGGSPFQLGLAAGPLAVGLILEYLQRTDPIVQQLSQSANLTMRQLGLMLSLAAMRISSGPAFVKMVFTELRVRAGFLRALMATVASVVMGLAGRALGLSTARTAGSMAGSLGQLALLAYTRSHANDERIEAGYTMIFIFEIALKIILVSVVLLFQLWVHEALAGFGCRFSI